MTKKIIGNSRHIIFLVLIILIISGTILTLFFALKTNPIEEILKNDQLINLLLVLENEGNAVSTIILTYYPPSRRGALINILGNTGAIFDSSIGRVDRIDAVYKEKGIDIYRKEIEKLVKQTIPFSIEISLRDFSTLTDLLGGLRVPVLDPIDDIIDDKLYLLPPGSVTLDGDKIITYITYANPEKSSIDPQDHIQNTIVSLLATLKTKRNNIFRKDIFPRYEQLMRSNINEEGVYSLLQEISMVDAQQLAIRVITGSLLTVDDQQLLFPFNDGQRIKEIVQQTISTLLSENEFSRIYVVEIQNGTTVQGLAQNTSYLLQDAGYDVQGFLNASKNDNKYTYIIDHIGNSEGAKSLGDFIRCTNIRTDEKSTENTENKTIDYTLVLGEDFNGRYVY